MTCKCHVQVEAKYPLDLVAKCYYCEAKTGVGNINWWFAEENWNTLAEYFGYSSCYWGKFARNARNWVIFLLHARVSVLDHNFRTHIHSVFVFVFVKKCRRIIILVLPTFLTKWYPHCPLFYFFELKLKLLARIKIIELMHFLHLKFQWLFWGRICIKYSKII